jgi:hypothetical protein
LARLVSAQNYTTTFISCGSTRHLLGSCSNKGNKMAWLVIGTKRIEIEVEVSYSQRIYMYLECVIIILSRIMGNKFDWPLRKLPTLQFCVFWLYVILIWFNFIFYSCFLTTRFLSYFLIAILTPQYPLFFSLYYCILSFGLFPVVICVG